MCFCIEKRLSPLSMVARRYTLAVGCYTDMCSLHDRVIGAFPLMARLVWQYAELTVIVRLVLRL